MRTKNTQKNYENIDWYNNQTVDVKISMLNHHLSICRLIANQLLEEEVRILSGERYSREKPNGGRYSRWGYNPGSIAVGNSKVQIAVPRIYDSRKGENHTLKNYGLMQKNQLADPMLMQSVLRGLSMNDYRTVVDHLGEGFGLSRASVSNKFKEQSEQALKEFESRKFNDHEFISLFIDGKNFGGEQMIIVLGITVTGQKIPLSFVQSATENGKVIAGMLSNLKTRGLKYKQGLLVVIDGSKGIHAAVKQEFGNNAVIQRCTWHKCQNILSYLSEKYHAEIRGEYYQALSEKTYQGAKSELIVLIKKLHKINIHAARSLEEGLEEVLSLHKLKLNQKFGRSFSTTNCIENLNSQLNKYTGKVKYWQNSNERHRWLAAALLNVEVKMKKVHNFKKLNDMKTNIQLYLKNRSKSKQNPS